MEDKIKRIIVEILKKEEKSIPTKINYDTLLREDLGFDSLMLAILTVLIEEEYSIDIFEDGIVRCFGEIIDIIQKNGGK